MLVGDLDFWMVETRKTTLLVRENEGEENHRG